MNILVTLDSHYIYPLQVMLKSMFLNNPGETFALYILHSGLSTAELEHLERFVSAHGSTVTAVPVASDRFADAPISFHYTKAMYFRLLAPWLLPANLDRVLYLDPDILILNPIRELYETDIRKYLYAAAFHDKPTLTELNRIRLHAYDIDVYYNSGVLLMNLGRLRREVREEDIFRFIHANRSKLVMPDQDILNSLYAKRIKMLDERYYNYDARFYSYYKLVRQGRFDMDRVINQTVVLHFCGKKKPWQKNYSGVFLALYKHYEKQANAPLPAATGRRENTAARSAPAAAQPDADHRLS